MDVEAMKKELEAWNSRYSKLEEVLAKTQVGTEY